MRTSRSAPARRSAAVALAVAAVAAVAVFSGCSADPGSPNPPLTVSPTSQAPSASTGSPVGSWGDDAQGKANVVFTSDDRLSGNDGCNHFSGSWKQGAGQVDVSAVVSTLMACPGVDVWLATMTSAKVDGDTLHVFKDGQEIGTLPRMP